MVEEVFFVSYANNVESKINRSDLIYTPYTPRYHISFHLWLERHYHDFKKRKTRACMHILGFLGSQEGEPLPNAFY
jgi:hypothetical protein